MRRSRFHEEQIVRLLRAHEMSGFPVAVFLKRHGGTRQPSLSHSGGGRRVPCPDPVGLTPSARPSGDP
jgi:hypothetical protein